MDLVGSASLVMDIPWLVGDFGSDNETDGDGAVLRASRASRVGARAARLTKLVRLVRVIRIVRVVKLLKYFRVFRGVQDEGGAGIGEENGVDGEDRGQDAQLEDAGRISLKLSEMIAKRVAALVMITVICMPLLAYPEPVDASIFSFLKMYDLRYAYWRTALTDGSGVRAGIIRAGASLSCAASRFSVPAADAEAFFDFYTR